MIRARFHTDPKDYRPIIWPIPHPYWCTGYGENHAVVVAYADDEAQILRQWPDATNIEIEQVSAYLFTSRFPKPEWFHG